MKLVVSFDIGDGCTYSCQCDTPIEYESSEQLLLDLEDMAERYISDTRMHKAKWENFAREYGAVSQVYSMTPKQREEWYTAHSEFSKTVGRLDYSCYRIENLFVTNFIEDDKFVAPKIYTLEEWFEAGISGDLG